MSIFDDFVNKASEKLQQGIEQVAPSGGSDPSQTPVNIGGTIFDAIYTFGRGRADTAVENLTAAFRKTTTGKKIEASATQQRIAELLPYILAGAAVLILGFFLIRRK